jgi:hypothetical protein
MREIEFRGKTMKGYFVCGLLSKSHGCYGQPPVGYYISNSSGMPWAYGVLTETIGQYTGNRDKNNIKIYEGDILKHVNTIRYVVYEEDCGGFVLVKQFPEYKEQRYIDFNCDAAIESEIIGTIYDNPELLTNH